VKMGKIKSDSLSQNVDIHNASTAVNTIRCGWRYVWAQNSRGA
jgi:hypothetical protein